MRNDANWSELRHALESKGLSPEFIVVAGFMEDSENNEMGVVITDKLQVFEFERNTSGGSVGFIKWRDARDPHTLLDTFPAVFVGLEIAKGLKRQK